MPADFRTATLQSWTNGLDLTTTEATDAQLTDAIAEESLNVDRDLDDHFETETGISVTVTAPRGTKLFLPKRVQSVTSVGIRNAAGTYDLLASGNWFVVSSISGSTVDIRKFDYLVSDLPYVWLGGYGYWPGGPAAVQVTGNFSWPVTPTAVKRLTAIYVWQRFKAFNAYGDAQGPVGENEIEGIISRYHRPVLIVA